MTFDKFIQRIFMNKEEDFFVFYSEISHKLTPTGH